LEKLYDKDSRYKVIYFADAIFSILSLGYSEALKSGRGAHRASSTGFADKTHESVAFGRFSLAN
jgi:hypothetical protein